MNRRGDFLRSNRDGIERSLDRAQRWPVPTTQEPDPVANLVLSVLLLALFAWGLLSAADWGFRTALFPRMVSIAGLALAALHLVQAIRNVVRGLRHDASSADTAVVDDTARPGGHATSEPVDGVDVGAVDVDGPADDEDDGDLEYLFRSADGRTWAAALGWVVFFFVLLYLAGLFITAGLFSLLYLRFTGKRSWLVSAGYAVILTAVLYGVFEAALKIATPTGALLP